VPEWSRELFRSPVEWLVAIAPQGETMAKLLNEIRARQPGRDAARLTEQRRQHGLAARSSIGPFCRLKLSA